MTRVSSGNKALHIGLWVAQGLLAVAYLLVGFMKATQPLDQLATMMKWVPDFSPVFIRGLGVTEIMGAIGLILPSLTRIQPRLTVLAAWCFVLLQVCAIALHMSRGEFSVLFLNAVLIGLAIFVARGRSRISVIAPRD